MAINRYTNITPSQFDPLSLQEIMLVPQMRRRQHDQILANQDAIRQGLLKVDPLDVHLNEAMQLRNNMNAKLDAQAKELATKGINPNTQADFINLNREYQNLIAPTGRIGQINTAKQVYNKELEDYLKTDDAQKYGRDVAISRWMSQNKAKYTGYDSKGNIVNIGSFSAPKYRNMQDDLKFVSSALGSETTTKAINNGFNMVPQPDGSVVVVDGSGNVIEKTNDKARLEAFKYLKDVWLTPEGEGFKSAVFAGKSPKQIQNELTSGVNMMRDYSLIDNRNNDYSLQGFSNKKDKEEVSNLEAVNVEGVNISRNSDLLNALNNKLNVLENASFGSAAGVFAPKESVTSKITTKDKVLNSPEYLTLARNISRTNSDLKGLNLNDKKVQDAVKDYLTKNKDVVVQNRYVDPNTDPTGRLFASKEVSKDKKATSELIQERALQGAYEIRDTKGELIKPEDLAKYDLTYSGDMTPKSQIGNIFTNPKQNIGARRGLLTDKESKESRKVYISRSSDDFNTPQFKAMETINAISKIADTQPGIYHPITGRLFDMYGLKDVEIKYNKGSKTYDLSYTDSDGTSVDQKFTDNKFQEFILNAYGSTNQ